jgi:hypothetical protein
MGEGSLYPKGRNPLNNKPRGRREKVLLILQEEILSQQQTKGKTAEGSLYPKGRNPLWVFICRGFLPLR